MVTYPLRTPTNFGLFALRSTGFNTASFKFDRGRIAETGTSGGLTTLKVVGLGNSTQDLYVTRFFDNDNNDVTSNFKTSPTVVEFIGAASTQGGAVDLNLDQITLTAHPFQNAILSSTKVTNKIFLSEFWVVWFLRTSIT